MVLSLLNNTSSKTHKATVERAAQWAIRATNPNNKLHSKENELIAHVLLICGECVSLVVNTTMKL